MSLDDRDPCCCERIDDETGRPWNDAGLSAVDYRVATHPEAKKRMLHRLSTQSFDITKVQGDKLVTIPGPDVLDSLTTRDDVDPTIALIDAWAVTCDVLSFYDERIANEGFLRTATERRSVLELAREIGYELNPGVSATAYLSFVVDDGPLAPKEATIAAGLAVSHVPQKDELPQTFETSEEVYVKATWNELTPELVKKQVLIVGHTDPLLIDGPVPEVSAGDYLVLQPDDANAGPEIKLVKAAEFDSSIGKTTLTIETVGSGSQPSAAPVAAMAVGGEPSGFSSVFGVQHTEQSLQSFSLWSNTSLVELEWASTVHVLTAILRDTPVIVPPVGGQPSALAAGVFAFRYRTANFGHNAPPYATLPASMREEWTENPDPPFPDDYEGFSIAAGYQKPWPGTAQIYLERSFTDLMPGEPFLIQTSGVAPDLWQIATVMESSVADYTMSVKATGLTLIPVNDGAKAVTDTNDGNGKITGSTQGIGASELTKYKLRTTSIITGAFGLSLSTLPVTDDLLAGATEVKLSSEVTGLTAGRYLVLTGDIAGWPGVERSELLKVKEVTHLDGQTTLTLEAGLQNSYIRTTVKINANVVKATHGETVGAEVLGSGDASVAFPRYSIKKTPLTHVPASTPTGAESTMSVYVNDVLWKPITNWYNLTPKDRAYKVTVDDDGKTWVGFGDGKRGARPPTGIYNIVASYRHGTGLGGCVAAETITLLKKKPLGIRSVTNMLDADGGDDPESRDDARSNAPKTVLTMGYVVSSADLENFARAYAGITKALATEVVIASTPTILLTLASTGEDDLTDDAKTTFKEAIADFGEPGIVFRITDFIDRQFEVTCKVTMNPDYIADNVKAAVEAALLAAFDFDERCFGQNVTYAEVVATIQRVDGVVRVDLEPLVITDLVPSDTTSAKLVDSTIVAQKAGWDAATKTVRQPALVTINPFAIYVTVEADKG